MGYNFPGTRVDLGGGRGWLDAPAAASLFRIDRAIGHLCQISEAGRTWDQQMRFWRIFQAGGNIALHPDTPSEHQKGKAVDSDEAQRFVALMEEHGWRRTVYRWVNGVWTLVERWHFEYFAHLDRHINDGAPASSLTTEPEPAPQPSEEDDMTEILSSPLGQSVHMGGIIVNFGSPDEVRAFKTEQGQPIRIIGMSATTHADLIAKANRRDVQRSNLPIIVREQGGQSIYVMTDGRISWLSDVTTVQNLIDQGALTVYWPKGEIENLIAQQKA